MTTATVTAVDERPLAASEVPFAFFGMPVVFTQRLYGRLDLDALAAAVDDLIALHPVLSARIVPTEEGYVLRLDPSLPAPRLSTDGDIDHVSTRYAPDTPIFRAVVVREDDSSHRLALSVNHVICDGVSTLTLLHTLWQSYTARVTGGTPALPPPTTGLPSPVEEHFRARFTDGQLADFLAERAAKMRGLAPACIPIVVEVDDSALDAGAHTRQLRLSAEQAVRLTGAAHASGVTLHALACGITLRAVHTQTDSPAETVTMTCFSALDLRRRHRPPLSRHHLVMAACAQHTVVTVGPDRHPADIGREVWEQLRAAVTDGTAEKTIAAMPQVMAEAVNAPMSVFVSNLVAKTQPLRLPPDLVSGPVDGCAMPQGPVPAVFLTGNEGDDDTADLVITLILARGWYTARQADDLAGAIERTLDATLSGT